MPTESHDPKPVRSGPAHEIRIGLIKAAIWANTTQDGVRHNVTFERRYRDGEQWKSSNSYGRDDLLTLAKVADEAHSWITQHSPRKSSEPDLSERPLPKPSNGSSGRKST